MTDPEKKAGRMKRSGGNRMEEEKKKHREGKEYRDLVNRLSRIE